MNLALLLSVAIGGFLGAPCRYVLDRAIGRRVESNLPWGTFVINVSGSFVLGFLTGLSLRHHLSSVANAALATGFCGAYTTFSTFTFETLRLVEDGQYLEATVNVVGSVVAGLGGAALGLAAGLAI